MLEHLFDAELQYQPGMEPIVARDRAGELVGSGDGTLAGPKLAGTLRWTLYESPGDLVCAMDPIAEIETKDGARIRLEARGYGRRQSRQDRTWSVAATLRFESEDERYRWLNDVLGVWEGEFDADAHRARYRAYVQENGTSASARRALEAADIRPARCGRQRTARLSQPEREFYFWILRQFAAAAPPDRGAMRAAARRIGLDPDNAFAALGRDDLVHADESGRPVVAYPFSAEERGHRVLIDGKHRVQAMCAIDALGIAPMLDLAIEIVSRDPLSGGEIWVRLDPAEGAWWEPTEAVVLAGSACREGPSFRGCCDVLNFFESKENAEGYLRDHPEVSGAPISLPDAIEIGRVVFGDALKAS